MNNNSASQSSLLQRCLFPQRTTNPFADLLLLAVRIYAGASMGAAGLDKLPTPDWMVEQVVQVGWFPAPELFATIACMTEFVCGLYLILGFLTPISTFLLAITMGVATFGFHKVTPFTGMNITQTYFWLYITLMVTGPGRFSVDRWLSTLLSANSSDKSNRSSKPALALCLALIIPSLGYGIYLETSEPAPDNQALSADIEINSISLAGSFNEWSLKSHIMEKKADNTWEITVEFDKSQPIQFKFAANGQWDLNLGDNDPSDAGFPISGNGELNGENIKAFIPEVGSYLFMVNTETFAFDIKSLTNQPITNK